MLFAPIPSRLCALPGHIACSFLLNDLVSLTASPLSYLETLSPTVSHAAEVQRPSSTLLDDMLLACSTPRTMQSPPQRRGHEVKASAIKLNLQSL